MYCCVGFKPYCCPNTLIKFNYCNFTVKEGVGIAISAYNLVQAQMFICQLTLCGVNCLFLGYATVKARSAHILQKRDTATTTATHATGEIRPISEATVSYDYIGEDPYLMGESSPAHDSHPNTDTAASSLPTTDEQPAEEVKYTKVATAMRLKVQDDDGDSACGELVHVVPETPVTSTEKPLGQPVGNMSDKSDVPQSQSSEEGKREKVDTFRPRQYNISTLPIRRENKLLLRKAAEAPASTPNPVSARVALAKRSARMSVDGIYDLMSSEDDPMSGLNTEERIMSIEMLVSDMCKSLDDLHMSGVHRSGSTEVNSLTEEVKQRDEEATERGAREAEEGKREEEQREEKREGEREGEAEGEGPGKRNQEEEGGQERKGDQDVEGRSEGDTRKELANGSSTDDTPVLITEKLEQVDYVNMDNTNGRTEIYDPVADDKESSNEISENGGSGHFYINVDI